MIGEVIFFSDQKGYGFIRQEDGTDIFVHQTAIRMEGYRTLAKGQKVEYQIGQNAKGKIAVDVVPGEVPEDAEE